MSRAQRRPMHLLVAALILVLVIAGSDAGINFSRSGSSSNPSAAIDLATPGADDIYVEGDIGAPKTLNPLLASSASERDLVPLLFSSLIRVDGSGKPQPELATGWSVSDDGLTYSVTLRDGARWQDGQPITPADVLFTIRLIQSPDFAANPALSDFWRGINVTIGGDDGLKFRLVRPFAPFLTYLTFPVLPKHVLGGVVAGDLATNSFSATPVGSGPFQLVKWDRGQDVIKLKRNDHYFGQRPRLDGVMIRYYQSSAKVLAAIKSGAVDGSGSLSTSDILRADALPSRYKIYSAALPGYTALFFNTRVVPFNQIDVRRAIGMAIDKGAIVQHALAGQGTVGTGPIPASSWAYAPVTGGGFDPNGALKRLEQAGWQREGGKLMKDGEQLSLPIIVNNDDPMRVAAAQQAAQQLEGIGINVSLSAMSSADLSRVLASGQFTAAVFGWRSTTGDPDSYELWSSSGATGGQDFTGLHDATIDEQLSAARTTSSLAERKALYVKFQQSFATTSPAIILYYPRYLFVESDEVHGVASLPVIDAAYRFDQIATWYVGTTDQATPGH